MEYKCDHKGFDREEIENHIEKYGCHVVMVIGDHLPGFAYSIGLYERFGHPEIICFGMDLNMMAGLINDACVWIREGNKVDPYFSYPDYLESADVKFIPIEKIYYNDYFAFGINYYQGNNFPALQMVWPDKKNKFPWEEGFYEPWKFQQPLLDRATGFKFYEERNLSVFTTRQVIEGNPVLYVYHDTDGEWQFHASDNITDENPVVTSLEEIIKRDLTINEVYNLKPGWCAWRENVNAKWKLSEFDFEE